MTKERRKNPIVKLYAATNELIFKRVENIICCPLPKYLRTPSACEVFDRLFEHFDTDRLTGLPGAYTFIERLNKIVEDRKQDDALNTTNMPIEHEPCSLIFCDINKFKKINDKLGEEKTDLLIRTLANFIKSKMRLNIDFIARYNEKRGDEFVILMDPIDCLQAEKRLTDIMKELDKVIFKFPNEEGGIKICMAHGVYELDSSVEPGQRDTATSALEKADMIMRQCKVNQCKKDLGQDRKISRFYTEKQVMTLQKKGYTIVPIDISDIGPTKLWTEKISESKRHRTAGIAA